MSILSAKSILGRACFSAPTIAWQFGSGRLGAENKIATREGKERFYERFLFELLLPFVVRFRSSNYFSCRKKGRHKGVQELAKVLPQYRYVYKTDVKSYYASVDLFLLFDILSNFGVPSWLLSCVRRCVISALALSFDNRQGLYRPQGLRGIRKGSPLSPLLGEVYLSELDRHFSGRLNTYYQRYVDDIILLADSRRELRKGIREIKQILRKLKLGTRYGKTYVGKSSDTIIYLGFRLMTFRLASGETKVIIEGVSRESKKRSRKRRAAKTVEVEKAVAAIEPCKTKTGLGGHGQKPRPDCPIRESGPGGSMLCFERGKTQWYALFEGPLTRQRENNPFIDEGNQTDSERISKILTAAEQNASYWGNNFGVRYLKLVGGGLTQLPRYVSKGWNCREKLPDSLVDFCANSFGERSKKWCLKGV